MHQDNDDQPADLRSRGTTAAPSRPRILLVTDRLPASDSGYGLRVSNVITGLRSVGELDVLVLDSSRRGERFPDIDVHDHKVVRAEAVERWRKFPTLLSPRPSALRYRNHRDLRAAIDAAIDGRTWDVVWYSRVAGFLYVPIPGVRRIVDFDDLNDRLLRTKIRDRTMARGRLRALPRQAWDRLDALRWSRLQRQIAERVERVAVCSRGDQRHLGMPNCVVVPNGYPDPAPGRAVERPTSQAPTLVFIGPLTYEPNLFAVTWFVRQVLPLVRDRLPGARFVVAGDTEGVDLRGLRAEGVELLGWVPDVATVYGQADVAVTPLHSGGGTRLKVIEALARQVPLVSTSFGSEGLNLKDGRDLLVADDPEAFADACVAVLTDDGLRQRLVRAGRERYLREMSSTVCSDAVAAVVQQVTGARRVTNGGHAAALPPR